MSGRRTTAILAALAGASLLAATAILILGGESPVVAPPPPVDVPGPAPVEAAPPRVRPVPPPAVPKRSLRDALLQVEDDAPPTARLKAAPRDRKPWARLRFVDGKTRQAIPFGDGRIALVVPRVAQRTVVPEPWFLAEDGRIEVFRSEDEQGVPFLVLKEEWAAAAVEVRIPGWEPRTFGSRTELEGEREIALVASRPSVRGTVRLGPGVEAKRLVMDLEPGDPSRDPRRPGAMPYGGAAKDGPFAWYDVPDGRWRLVVRGRADGIDTPVAAVEFDRAGDEVDLGEIVLRRPSTIRARVVARDGTGVLDTALTLYSDRKGTSEIGDGMDEDGWRVFRGLEPDAEFRVISSLDKLSETVRTPAEGGGDIKVELRWENRGVRCRIRFTVEGQDPIQWGDLIEGPTLEKEAWRKDGQLEHDMAPGDYLIGAWARPVGKDQPVRVYGKFTVPDKPLWEATVDLKEPK